MPVNMPDQIRKYGMRRRCRRVWSKVVIGMAAAVIFATAYMLILPAITMEKTAYCGMEEHQHGPECFEQKPICGYASENPHVHTEGCYEAQEVLICGEEEQPPHIHDESCMETEETLVCTEDHEHTEACYQVTENCICGLDETGHTHSPECYGVQQTLICGYPEVVEGHVHSGACYEETLTCTQEVHTHSLACYANPNADLETQSVWEQSFTGVTLTGDWANDVLAIAESQLGYTESTENYIVTDDGSVKGYTRYGAWYGDCYGDWCAMFAAFCLHYAGVEDYPLDANCQHWIEQLEQPEYNSYYSNDAYTPKPGDLVFFQTGNGEMADHIGIVVEYAESEHIKTIEGNSADCVQYVTYGTDDPRILGYGCIPENPESHGKALDAAIGEINRGLNLGVLEIGGKTFTDDFYYGNVAKDSRVPFQTPSEYAEYLAGVYLDAGGGDPGLSAVSGVWDYYLYDLYDPNATERTSDSPAGTYGDTDLEWPQDSSSSFHGASAPQVDGLGDAPVAMILQVQSSWQMFDLNHANAGAGDGAASCSGELATLYDIKHALLRFADYMEANFPGNNLLLGITETQHAGSQSMFQGTDAKGNGLYVTNDYGILRQSILDWDSFGNCGHVHYDTSVLKNAVNALPGNLQSWEEAYGQEIEYEDIQKVAVIIGGPAGNSGGGTGDGYALPWGDFQEMDLNSVYGIRTNDGTPSSGDGLVSWLDHPDNNSGSPFEDSAGTSFTEKYVATTEDAVFYALVEIAETELGKAASRTSPEDTALSDAPSDDPLLAVDTLMEEPVENQDAAQTVMVYNTPTGGSAPEQPLPHNKTIDYLCDGVENPDTDITSETDELYRLYLDVSGASYTNAVDLVLVIDRSASMYKYRVSDKTMRRDEAVAAFLNGTDSETGFIADFLGMNPDNKLSMVWFGGDTKGGRRISAYYSGLNDSGVITGWMQDPSYQVRFAQDIAGLNENATNYMAGLWEAANQLTDPSISDDGNIKMMLFLTDGQPTVHVQTGNTSSAVAASYADYLAWIQAGKPDTLYRTGSGTVNVTEMTRSATLASISEFKTMFPNAVIGSVMFGTDNTEYTGKLMANGGSSYQTESSADLKRYIMKLVKGSSVSAVTITDALSQYVQWYGASPDLKVTGRDADGSTITLWESSGSAEGGQIGAETENNYIVQDDDTIPVVQDVTFTPSEAGAWGGTLTVTFNPALKVDSTVTYTVSFNVQTSEAARNEYQQNIESGTDGYNGSLGDAGTDYGRNFTSSGQPGFPANQGASVTYTYDGESREETYLHPVIQVVNHGYALPEAGGAGTTVLTLCGFGLMACPLMYRYLARRRRERRETAELQSRP